MSNESIRVDAIRLPKKEYEMLEELATDRALPLRTLARSLLVQGIREANNA